MSILEDLKLQYKMGGIVQQLIFWNIGIAVVLMLLFAFYSDGYLAVMPWVELNSNISVFASRPWTIFTYQFVHVEILHLLFNMIMLNFSGRLFLTFFTQKQFIGAYLLGGFFAGLLYIVSYFIIGNEAQLIGASGAIMTIMIAVAVYAPLYEVRLLLIGRVKLWHIALVFVVLDLIQISSKNMGGHIAHLGGAFFGFFYIKMLQNGTDLSLIVTRSVNFFVDLFKPKKSTPFKKVHKNKTKTTTNPVYKSNGKDKSQQQIDEILDKISQSGYDSLTKDEKEFLFRAGKN